MSTDDLKPCPLCKGPGSKAGRRQPYGPAACCDGDPECAWYRVMVPLDAWQALPRQSTLTIESTPPDPLANKNHHALHLVAEKWEQLNEGATCCLAPYQQIAQVAHLMAETCRAIASTTCELYAPGKAGSDGHTTCSGRGLPECATCNALDVGGPPEDWTPNKHGYGLPWPQPADKDSK